jgi:hypothetical protein
LLRSVIGIDEIEELIGGWWVGTVILIVSAACLFGLRARQFLEGDSAILLHTAVDFGFCAEAYGRNYQQPHDYAVSW